MKPNILRLLALFFLTCPGFSYAQEPYTGTPDFKKKADQELYACLEDAIAGITEKDPKKWGISKYHFPGPGDTLLQCSKNAKGYSYTQDKKVYPKNSWKVISIKVPRDKEKIKIEADFALDNPADTNRWEVSFNYNHNDSNFPDSLKSICFSNRDNPRWNKMPICIAIAYTVGINHLAHKYRPLNVKYFRSDVKRALQSAESLRDLLKERYRKFYSNFKVQVNKAGFMKEVSISKSMSPEFVDVPATPEDIALEKKAAAKIFEEVGSLIDGNYEKMHERLLEIEPLLQCVIKYGNDQPYQ